MFTSPKFIAGLLGGVVVGAAGSTLLLFNDKGGTGLELRKKLATAIRDMADKAIDSIENLEKTIEDLEDRVEGEEQTAPTSRTSKRAKTEEPAVN